MPGSLFLRTRARNRAAPVCAYDVGAGGETIVGSFDALP
jgi:hypothetical protein